MSASTTDLTALLVAPAATESAVKPNTELPAKTNYAPSAKVSAGVLAAAATTLILACLPPKLGAQVGAALTTLITFVVQYIVPERP